MLTCSFGDPSVSRIAKSRLMLIPPILWIARECRYQITIRFSDDSHGGCRLAGRTVDANRPASIKRSSEIAISLFYHGHLCSFVNESLKIDTWIKLTLTRELR